MKHGIWTRGPASPTSAIAKTQFRIKEVHFIPKPNTLKELRDQILFVLEIKHVE
jgi:hypothetical protein